MAKRVILVSDVSGKEIPDEEQVEVQVLSYPGLNMPVKLDASKTEATGSRSTQGRWHSCG